MPDRTPPAQAEGRTTDLPQPSDVAFEPVQRAIKGQRFGEVRLIIQDGLIVQIERIEKQRLR